MSHFSVAVLSQSPDDVQDLMAPFDANNEEYMEFEPVSEDEYLQEYETGTYTDCAHKRFTYKETYPTFKDFMINCKEFSYLEDRGDSYYGYQSNINARWEWFVQCGPDDRLLRLKDGTSCSQARVRDVDFSPDPTEYAAAIRRWEITVEGCALHEGEQMPEFKQHKPEYLLQQFGTKERYAASCAKLDTWAILTEDGEWHEKGCMGLCGMSDVTMASRAAYQETFDQLIAENPDLFITIVYCNI